MLTLGVCNAPVMMFFYSLLWQGRLELAPSDSINVTQGLGTRPVPPFPRAIMAVCFPAGPAAVHVPVCPGVYPQASTHPYDMQPGHGF